MDRYIKKSKITFSSSTNLVTTTSGRLFVAALSILLVYSSIATAQSGSDFSLSQIVITPAGEKSTVEFFVLDSTTAQPAASGRMSGEAFTLTPGFWTFTPQSPTAADAYVGGRVIAADGTGISYARLVMIGPSGEARSALSSPLGYYRFDNVLVGQSYVISISSRRHTFSTPSIVVMVLEDLADANFYADPPH